MAESEKSMMTSFKDFYEHIGFEGYPFFDRTAEKEDTTNLFISPPNYSILMDAFDSGKTAIISGNRGTGKTIILLEIQKKELSNGIVSYIQNYESIPLTNNILDFYSLILKSIIAETLVYLSKHKASLNKLSKEDKIFLSFLIMKYADSYTSNDLYSKIENVQLSLVKRIVNRISMPITTFLNFGTTAVVNFGNDLINQHFRRYLPTVDAGKILKIIPDIRFEVADDFRSASISYSLLDKSLELINRMLGKSPIVIFDKFDEDIRLENDADLTSTFIRELVCDNNLLHNKYAQFFISVWEIPFSSLSPWFRRSKHTVFDIRWKKSELEQVLNRRLFVYSGKAICDYNTLFSDNVSEELKKQIFTLSYMNPRGLWEILDSVFIEQHSMDCESKSLCALAVKRGLINFVNNFDFYEYYPKKKAARKNTNDVYSYITHLLKLKDTDEFTEQELREAASTGGSTGNYITGMVNMGLVKKTNEKRAGGAVIYKVHDPKISFAISEKLDITH